MKCLKDVLALGVLIVLVLSPTVTSAQTTPEFKLGFKTLAELIPAIVGNPLENERHNPENGDGLQQTTTGLMVWRKADNWTAFTDGSRTWINGPYGLQVRPNDQRFKWETVEPPQQVAPPVPTAITGSVLSKKMIVSWYGNPHTGAMGVLGQFTGDELASRLQRQADAYAPLTTKEVQPAYELIAVVAQGSPGPDGLWRRREDAEVIDSMLQQARAHGFVLILDVQVGQSTVQDELAYLQPWLAQPDVYLALDPEFDMWTGQTPGIEFGHTMASEVNYAIEFLDNLIRANGLPPKVLIVHQFRLSMLPDKENIGRGSAVDVVLDMDGFGGQALKLDSYEAVMQQPLEYAGVKLFYDQDPNLFSPNQVMGLDPVPSVVIYQ